MKRLSVEDGCFVHPSSGEALRSLNVVIVDKGTLSRSYYVDDERLCWSYDCDRPDARVHDDNKQANRCLDCVRGIQRGGNAKGTACKFFTNIKVALLDADSVYSLRLSAASIFAKEGINLGFYKYIDYLKNNDEQPEDIVTEIYLSEHYGYHKICFKPVRPLASKEAEQIEHFLETDDTQPIPFQEVQPMAYTQEIIKGVIARYPKLDQPYVFDEKMGAKGRSVPCEATRSGANYEVDIDMSRDQAKTLYSQMTDDWKNCDRRTDKWPKKLPSAKEVFEKQEDGTYRITCRIKASYDGDPTRPPKHYDSQGTALPDGFKLTTGSTINVLVEFYSYCMSKTNFGVSLRLRGVQVIKYIPYTPPSPFEKEEDGFTVDQAPAVEHEDNPFAQPVEEDDEEEEEDDSFDDDEDEELEEVKEPKKAKSKKEKVPADDEETSEIIGMWEDEDEE